jgi:16S rRNA (cytidine1402-2'-O)-methyltransferase
VSAPSGTLLVVATPIGNLGDLTLRAVETLREADRVVAEDTRRARALLSHLGIAGKPVDRVDEHAPEAAIARVVEHLQAGERVALVTDAGTPIVSDPGTALVRAAIAAGVAVVPIPGASAVMAAVSVAGLVEDAFTFRGFLPRSGRERRDALAKVLATEDAVVIFEAPGRIAETLAELATAAPTRRAMVGRELTKLHEELLRGTLAELAAAAPAREWLGEITLVLGPAPRDAAAELPTEAEIDARIDAELAAGRRAKDVAEQLALETGRPRRDLYARVVERKSARER